MSVESVCSTFVLYPSLPKFRKELLNCHAWIRNINSKLERVRVKTDLYKVKEKEHYLIIQYLCTKEGHFCHTHTLAPPVLLKPSFLSFFFFFKAQIAFVGLEMRDFVFYIFVVERLSPFDFPVLSC